MTERHAEVPDQIPFPIPDDIAEKYARIIEINLRHGDIARARLAIVHACEEADSRIVKVEVTDPVSKVFDTRTANRLESCGMLTIQDVLNAGFERLCEVSQFNELTVARIERILEKAGHPLGHSPIPKN